MSSRKIAIFLAAILALGFALYGDSLPNSFQLDDQGSIVKNSAVQRGDIRDAVAFWPGRALIYGSFAAQVKFFGAGPAGLRAGNVVGHALTAAALAWLLYGLLRLSVPGRDPLPAALLAALIFLTHPLQTQAVTYIVQRAASWCALFSLLSLAAYTHSLRSAHPVGLRTLAVLLALLAMTSKEFAIVVPLVAVALDLAFAQRPGRWRRLAPMAATLVVVPLIAAVWANFGEFGSDSLAAQSTRVSRLSYLLTQFEVTARYGQLALLPMGQNVDHDIAIRHGLEGGSTILWLLPHLATWLLGYILFRRNHRVGAFCILFIYLSLAPESSIFPIFDPMFEHRCYLAMGGVAMLAGMGLASLLRKSRPAGTVAALTLLLLLSVLTFQRNRVWRTPETLWSDAVAKSPEKGRPRYALGVAYAEQGRLSEAKQQFDLAIEYSPYSARAWTNLGKAHLALGDTAEALRCFRYILSLKPEHQSAWYHTGVAHDRAGQWSEARSAYERALALDPEHTLSLNGIASVELKLGDVAAARRHAEAAARLGSPAPRLLQALRQGG